MRKIIAITALLITANLITETAISQDYKLVWSEEFNGESIDSDTWNFWEEQRTIMNYNITLHDRITLMSRMENYTLKQTGKIIGEWNTPQHEYQQTVPKSVGNTVVSKHV